MKEDRLELLLHALFEESLGDAERAELNVLLAAEPPSEFEAPSVTRPKISLVAPGTESVATLK